MRLGLRLLLLGVAGIFRESDRVDAGRIGSG